ncbi:MAG: hypothetical protein GY719_22630 [bacterium]|nr:hypothetical protein [bacterium]
MPYDLRRSLTVAYPIALRWLRPDTACSALFRNLGADGPKTLSSTLYFPAEVTENPPCWRAAAFTRVGGRVTFLCEGFSRLPASRAAVILLHEALHSAGVDEQPHDPDALTSSQITQLVARTCFSSIDGLSQDRVDDVR